MRTKSIIGTVVVFVGMFYTLFFSMGCSFDPLKFAGRNACEFLNCDVLFFVDDILPLSGGPVEGGGAAPAESDEAGGGH